MQKMWKRTFYQYIPKIIKQQRKYLICIHLLCSHANMKGLSFWQKSVLKWVFHSAPEYSYFDISENSQMKKVVWMLKNQFEWNFCFLLCKLVMKCTITVILQWGKSKELFLLFYGWNCGLTIFVRGVSKYIQILSIFL